MANRRMFSKSITNSSQFLMMPQSSQNLYFHLGMNADDDGFCEHFAIMRMTDSKPDDLKVLQAKNFVQVFDDKVLVIIDWKENNYLRSDRYTPSKYLEIYKEELKALSSGIPTGNQWDTQDRIGKDRIGENTNKSVYTDQFNQFWDKYPKKEKKKQTYDIWKRKKLDIHLEVILKFLEKASETDRWKKGFVKQPTTFLNGECWNDDITSYNDKNYGNQPNNLIKPKQGKYDHLS